MSTSANVVRLQTPTVALPEVEDSFYVRGVEKLVHVVQELSLARDLVTVQDIVKKAARELTGADGATFVLRDNDHCYYADEDAIEPLWKGKRFPMSICVSGWVMLNQQATVIDDIYVDPRIPAEAYRPTFVKSLAMVPIRSRAPIGAIGNYWARHHHTTRNELRLLKALADTTAVAMENIEIYASLERKVQDRTAELQAANQAIQHLALTDELTQLFNRRGFMLMAQQQLKAARDNDEAAHLYFMDLNGLKTVNDKLGHDIGDAMIARFSGALRACFRDTDVIGRLGGDEFCVFANADSTNGQMLLQRLRAQLCELNAAGGHPALSASIGVVDIQQHPDASLEVLMGLADDAMYQDKRLAKAQGSSAA